MARRGSEYVPVKFNPDWKQGDPILPTLASMREHLNRIYELSKQPGIAHGTNFVTGGEMGHGKTVALETAPKPVLIHSFDPDGSGSIKRELLESGAIMVNRTFEEEYIAVPAAYRRWFNEFNYLRNAGVFNHMGTYSIDSGTMFAEAAMYYFMHSSGRAAQIPQQQDYLGQQLLMQGMFKYVCSLPCNVVINFHLESVKNNDGALVAKEFLISGKAAIRIPLLFSEVYCLVSMNLPEYGIVRKFITQPWGLYKARTRMGREGGFQQQETADYGYLLKKGGRAWEDKPPLAEAIRVDVERGAAEQDGIR